MPKSAVENVAVDNILPVSEIENFVELAYKPVEEEAEAVSREMEMESDMAELDLAAMQSSERPGTPSPLPVQIVQVPMGTAGRKANSIPMPYRHAFGVSTCWRNNPRL